ncbi:MAG: cytochrome c oxidase assembly protein subunit 15 [Cognaticolwellia sp.]|jgi:cytochrome c oxidase assembly protein subunit 15
MSGSLTDTSNAPKPSAKVLRAQAWSFIVLTVMTYLLVIFGAIVRAQGAGLACPDWPLCFGELIPALDFGVFFEWGHRALAGSISLILLGLSIWVASSAAGRKLLGKWLIAAWLVLLVQIVLGGLTVLKLLASWTVTSHLLVGNSVALSFGLLAVLLWRGYSPQPRQAIRKPVLRILLPLTAALLVLQMALGGLVSSQHAGLACVNWPACVGTLWFPTWEGPVGLHLLHRTTAYIVALSYVLVAVLAWDHDSLGRKARIALALVFVQVALGVANVLWQLPVEVTAAHSAVAAMLCLTTGLMIQDYLQRPLGSVESSPAHPTLGEIA